MMYTRRDVLGSLVGAPLAASVLWGCSREGASSPSPVASRQSPASPRVVVATSTDDFLARPIATLCEEATGIGVDLITDTEATKAIALVQRVRMSKDRSPSDAAIDVWWSSEVLGTIALAQDGLLAPWPLADSSQSPVASRPSPSPPPWREFAARARVIAHHTGRIASDPPTRLRDLVDPRFRGMVAMARPQFGSTRGHIAGLIALHGEPRVRDWLLALRENKVRVVEGNSAVVKAIAQGEASVGLTDSDDVWVGIDNAWPVACSPEVADDGPVSAGLPSAGAFLFPNTVGVLANAPRAELAWKVAAFLCSSACELAMAKSLSRNIPLDGSARAAAEQLDPRVRVATPWATIDWSAMAREEGGAIARCDALLRELFPL